MDEENWMPKNWCFWTVILEKTLESPLDSKEIKPVVGRTDAEAEAPILWSPDANSQFIGRPWCWERLKAKGEEGSRGWNSWMASLIQWTWTWVNSRRWWGAGRPGMLQSMGSKRVGHNLATDSDNVERSSEAKKVTPTFWLLVFSYFPLSPPINFSLLPANSDLQGRSFWGQTNKEQAKKIPESESRGPWDHLARQFLTLIIHLPGRLSKFK